VLKIRWQDTASDEWEDYACPGILCEYEALAYLRLRHLGQYFMEPSDYFDVPTSKILRSIQSAGLLSE
jgi:hypothetical protein